MGRVLLLPHAPTSSLAHVGACLAVGRELRARGHEAVLGYGGTRPEIIEQEGFPWQRVPEVAPEREWARGGWFESSDELHRLVRGHRELIDALRPDVAVSSSGIAGRLACELAGVPQVHLMHYLQISPYGRQAVVWGDRLGDARRPRRVARVLRRHVRTLRTRGDRLRQRAIVARVREESRLPALAPGAWGGVDDSLIALTTTPFLDPAHGLPDRWRYVGPLAWSAPAAETEPELRPRRSERPLVYVTQGTTGDPKLLRAAVKELAAEPVDVLVTTGGLCEPAEIAALGRSVRAAPLLPGRACLERADAAVIHGGHLSFCETLATGTPMVVLPYRGDQVRRVHAAERLGVGIGVWPRPWVGGPIRRAVRRLLRDCRYGARGAELAALLRDWDGAAGAADLVEEAAR